MTAERIDAGLTPFQARGRLFFRRQDGGGCSGYIQRNEHDRTNQPGLRLLPEMRD